MKAFLKPFDELQDINELRDRLQKHNREYFELSGVTSSGKSQVIYGISEVSEHSLVVVSDDLKAKELYEELSFYRDDVYIFPGKDMLFFQSDIRGNALTIPRVNVLARMISGESFVVIATIDSMLNTLQKPEEWAKGIRELKVGDEIDTKSFARELSAEGYERVTQVEQPGEYAIRGGILDIFSLTDTDPFRVELWGDEIDLIKRFNASDQKSTDQVESVKYYPACEFVLEEEDVDRGIEAMKAEMKEIHAKYRKEMKTEEAFHLKSTVEAAIEKMESGWIRQEGEVYLPYFLKETGSLLDYLPEDTVCFIDEPRHIEETSKQVAAEFAESMMHRLEAGYILPRQRELLLDEKVLKQALTRFGGVVMSLLDSTGKWLKITDRFHIRMQQGSSFNGSFEMLCEDIKKYRAKKFTIVIVSPSHSAGKRIAKDLFDIGVPAFYSDREDYEPKPGEVMVTFGRIQKGYEFSDSNFVFISEGDIFGAKKKKRKKRVRYEGEHISGFRDLKPGDYVVHENHGLGIYRGMEKIEVDGVLKDYLKLEYSGGSNLYVLATQLSSIQKYGNASDKKPKLSSLGSLEWSKTKARVKTAVGIIAKELVNLYALRQQDSGYVFDEDTEWQKEFEEAFPYEETDGQLEAIRDVKHDMESPKIMDRLICGDVGFGKTEVAIRAAFKAVQENKQVAYLVPTTILAEQHYNNFVQRLKDFPVNVVLLSRFRTPGEVKKAVKKLETGEADIAIGTHRLLSKDVHFKDLGLLIIDEEQRFGVGHKEKIKQLKKNVDVLSMSATPIPRTLHMSLTGIRDMSVLDEPPRDRQPIQTFVFEYNDELIREAIVREMARGGQVYYVINQIKTIAEVADHIQALMPDATVAYAHGRMQTSELEDIMYQFINHEIDILVATTIIETGIDISNVNTIIIHDADKMGLSQLYQLRGRVGRGNRTAYAFFLYRKDKMLKEDAEKRLSAIREFTELGSGFKIAMRDLEIRGAGNMLGKEQHGHMASVGYDLYCKMLNEAVLVEKGEAVESVDFDTVVEINLDSFIPQSYIPDEAEKLNIYKRIADISTEEEKEEMLDELLDRFGEPTRSVQNLCEVSFLRSLCHRAYIEEIRERENGIRVKMYKEAKIDVTKIPAILDKLAPYVSFQPLAEGAEFFIDTKRDSRIKKLKTLDIMRSMAETIIELAIDVVE